jgi:MFS transporter, NNP family, nitrate/nitrite transporter
MTNPTSHALDDFNRRAVMSVSTLSFTILFAVWVVFAIIGVPIRKEFSLSDGQFALLVAIPILTGSLLRLPVGIWSDQFGGRKIFAILCFVCAVPTYFLSRAQSYNELLALAFLVGIAGTSFAVGVSWNGAWFPSAQQGFALGVFGAGNVGASITKLLAPTLITVIPAIGLGVVPGAWRFVPWIYSIVLVMTGLMILSFTPRDRNLKKGKSFAEMLLPLKQIQVWRFGLYYWVVFGAYVGLSLTLPKYYVDVYGIDLKLAGLLTSLFIFPASLLRPYGGYLSDRFGARKLMYGVFLLMAAALTLLLLPQKIIGVGLFTALMVVVGVGMGIGKAANMKMVAVWFPNDVGATGGMVGMIGGLGGFFLPLMFAQIKALTNTPQSIFAILIAFTLASLAFLHIAVLNIRIKELEAKTVSTTEVRV